MLKLVEAGDNGLRRAQMPVRDPVTAAMLSFLPGLGQLYNGQSRKGILFIDVAIINFLLVALVLLAEPLIKLLGTLSINQHFKLNGGIMAALYGARLGSPFSIVIMMLVLGFVAYAVRDAYDTAQFERRKEIYSATFMEMSEAASGSYLMHAASLAAIAILAMFFLVPQPRKEQITEIKFVSTPEAKVVPPRDAKIASVHPMVAGGKPKSGPTSLPSAANQAHRAPPAKNLAQKPESHQDAPRSTTTPEVSRPPQPHVSTPTASAQPPLPRPVVTLGGSGLPKPLPAAAQGSAPSRQTPTPTIKPAVAAVSAPAPIKLDTAPQQIAMLAQPTAVSSIAPQGAAAPLPAAPRREPGASSPGPAIAPVGRNVSLSPALPNLPLRGADREHSSSTGSAPLPRRHSPDGMVSVMPHPAVANSGESSDFRSEHPIAKTGDPGIDAKPVDFSAYMADLERRIKRTWTPPHQTYSRSVVVTFQISLAGELSNLRLEKSSGLAAVDEAAMKAVTLAAPFRRLPQGARDSVDIQFTFDYRVFSGGGGGFTRY